MRMSMFLVELLLGVSVKYLINRQVPFLPCYSNVWCFFSDHPTFKQLSFFQTMTFAFGFIMLCQSEFRSSRSYSLDLFGTVLLTVTVISFGDPKLSDMTTSMKYEGDRFVTATHLSATKEDCEKHVDTDQYINDIIKPQLHSTHESKMTYELSFQLICFETRLYQTDRSSVKLLAH